VAIYILSDASLGTIQDIVTITFEDRPSRQRINGVLWQQQRIRTITEGLISRETSTELAQEMFPGISSDAVEQLFVESKQRYLRGRDLEAS
jgi:hypothetical protein